MCNQMFLYFNICYYLWEVMHNATFENIFNIPAKENPLKKISQVLMNAGMGYSLQSLF